MPQLIFDTETTGMINFKAPASDRSQPDLIQLGLLLVDGPEIISEVGLLVRPMVQTEIEPGAYEAHGITFEQLRYGVDAEVAAEVFLGMLKRADILIAHNYNFDIRVINTLLQRVHALKAIHSALEASDPFAEVSRVPKFCTMMAATPICRVPYPSGRKGNKWPKLMEAYKILVDAAGFEGAHRALTDCYATHRLLCALVEREGCVLPV